MNAIIDVGTNSVLLLLAQPEESGLVVYEDRSIISRLGDKLHAKGFFSEEAMERTLDAIFSHKKTAIRGKAKSILLVGTQALRIAKNTAEFIRRVRFRCGLTVHVITKEQEAYLTYLGAGSVFSQKPRLVFDLGGGSTEFIFSCESQRNSWNSLDFGAVVLSEAFHSKDWTQPQHVDDLIHHVDQKLNILPVQETRELIGVGGTVTTMAAVYHGLKSYKRDVVHGTTLSRREVNKQFLCLLSLPAEERASIPGMETGRSDIILAGIVVVDRIMEKNKVDKLLVSDQGMRHALAENPCFLVRAEDSRYDSA
jgi:exopolyphosphatase/guanosine-5'-triphosphate,3'-diphosphate pyrophosphatase